MTTDTWSVANGWQWRAYLGDEDSPDQILGGWALTEQEAEQRAKEALEE